MDMHLRILREALDKGFQEAVVRVVESTRTMAKIANSEPSVVQHWRSLDVGLYLVKDRRIMVAEVKGLDPARTSYTLSQLLSLAGKLRESELYAPLPEPGEPVGVGNLVDSEVIRYIEDPSSLAEEVITAAHEEKVDYVAGMIDLKHEKEYLASSKGFEGTHEYTSMESYLRAFAGEEGSGQWSTCSTRLRRDKLVEMARIAARYAVDSRSRQDIEPGVYDLVLSPMVFGNLLDYISYMASGFSIMTGMSMFMGNKPGDKVASEKLTLIDNPHEPELPGSRGFDMEGARTSVKPIIERGVLANILHNSKTAAKFNTVTTGNAGWISPEPWNLIVEPGDYGMDELIGEVRRGILVNNNWYTRFQNYVEGEFSTITRDALFLIENGGIKAAVRKIRIADRLGKVLRNIDGLTRERYDVKWWEVSYPTRAPYILVRGVNTSKHTA
ncbi:peptidase U62 modulator of DNA gyrase [Desulfurococcus mucosus DSM 2162]|uniref:Peptidase U62 modulator of DNA gyrase n=2 Tax=Desulfurococcus mucosus TaxID=2275 RepID=E8R9Z4_DESM0|nr:peptidase U62 modulator of DNA gyrase [Desulfurococcus mucosus DSM 2162]